MRPAQIMRWTSSSQQKSQSSTSSTYPKHYYRSITGHGPLSLSFPKSLRKCHAQANHAAAPLFLWNLSIAHYITSVRRGAKSRKATASILHGVTGIFHWLNPSPGVDSASNRNEYWEYILGIRRPVRRAHNLATIVCRLSKRFCEHQSRGLGLIPSSDANPSYPQPYRNEDNMTSLHSVHTINLTFEVIRNQWG